MNTDGREFTIGQGESLEHLMAVYEDGVAIALDDYTVSTETYYSGSLVTSFGTASIVNGSPDKIKFVLSDSESADLDAGVYSTMVTLVNTDDTDETVFALNLSINILDDSQLAHIPICYQKILQVLQLSISDFPTIHIRRAAQRAETRALMALPKATREWCRDYGWQKVVPEVEQLAAMLLKKDIYPGLDGVQDEINEVMGVISGISVDTDADNLPDAGARGFTLSREG